ncbi:malto-oligosyltrehalose synthase [Micromonospora sp. WMMC415]|uniref:malto-oligosyltrehalose synthase n=1 Tax=Micromonospora sp. WMMC415 TaxID=2675222 RepID=UPI0012B4D5C2|nr:malto-oligosyltrehalose synthase [Micromonospora sp. WMMC415]QGN48354.1 malto-oligosyltrehalose synthase [Micromonospora sp. WMMC415]
MAAPTSTYRLQVSPRFTLTDAAGLVDYLDRLGVGAVYTSPLLAATPGSDHGYDLTDPFEVDPDRGGEAGRRELVDRLRRAGLGLVVDVVCNHMGVADAAANPWWWDVLRRGPGSPYAGYFDVDWSAGPLLLPVLADDGDGGTAAERDLKVVDDTLTYHEHRFPLAPGTGTGPVGEVHARQHYRLVGWRRGVAELTYRRFFNIDTLACLRTERDEVFDAVHALPLRWIADGEVTGLRIDHPDGLADPTGYLRRLRAAAPHAWIVVEKVVAVGENLPATWPVDGTTGYEALREICGVFVDPGGRDGLAAAAGPAGRTRFPAVARAARRHVVDTLLVAETHRIVAAARAVLPEQPAEAVTDLVRELLVAMPAYRAYLPAHRWTLDEAVTTVAREHPRLAGPARRLRDEMVARPAGPLAVRFQQSTGAVSAKGVEDTAFYRHQALVALGEVGGDPDRFGVPPAEFHAANAAREAARPATMTTLSTHDTKRAEDVRARLAVLSELPGEWAGRVRRWSARCPVGDPAVEPLAWQTLVGAWPIGVDRLADHLLKVVREMRTRTDWLRPDPAYEGLVRDWPRRVAAHRELLAEVAEFVGRIAPPGWSNALGQKLLQLAGPGVPDVYQGTELWDHSLVDPDNRRPVDFALRRRLLDRIEAGWLPPVDETGAAKLLLTARTLGLRRSRPALFRGYRPVSAEGPARAHLVGFHRAPGLAAVATRLPVGLAAAGGWRDTLLTLPGAGWTDVLTGQRHDTPHPRVSDVLGWLPVALLVQGRQS